MEATESVELSGVDSEEMPSDKVADLVECAVSWTMRTPSPWTLPTAITAP